MSWDEDYGTPAPFTFPPLIASLRSARLRLPSSPLVDIIWMAAARTRCATFLWPFLV